MDLSTIICKGFGLQELLINDVKFYDEAELRMVISGTLPRHLARCGACGCQFYEVHQWHNKTIKLPPWSHYQKCTLQLKYPRGFCSFCLKVQSPKLENIHPKFKGLSCSFVELAGRMMEDSTCAAASRWFKSSPSLMWKVDQWRMKYLKENHYKIPEKINFEKLSADEVHFLTYHVADRSRSRSWRAEFITNLVATKEAKVIANSPGRGTDSLTDCLKKLSRDQLKSVKYFAIDMNPGYFPAIKKHCPQAKICVDRFHLIQLMNKCIDRVRSQEYTKASRKKDAFQMTMLGASKRYLIMENRNKKAGTLEEQNMLGKLKVINDNIHNAILITDYFHKILDHKSISKFRRSLGKWYRIVRESKSKIFLKFAKMVCKYRHNIEGYIRSNLTTAVSEGLNNKIKVLKRSAYSYTNKKSYQNKILQRCGYLNSKYIDTNFLFWHVPAPQI